ERLPRGVAKCAHSLRVGTRTVADAGDAEFCKALWRHDVRQDHHVDRQGGFGADLLDQIWAYQAGDEETVGPGAGVGVSALQRFSHVLGLALGWVAPEEAVGSGV